ncbi:VRR-NUC domain-containing protein [Noviherbaspirillum aridicola]|uniref:phosphodiesterase I n=1 Tax=Noviherbaspirillum aridicola TaxID=2849687 RepID=A0ABQ4Q083_9BURK|nr:VRR-NUC domain-containing protein [Noviherbaspirillum aridicola]GIZ50451.1 Fanconi-associated nuclease [Noviherbaspirillum aridicola]
MARTLDNPLYYLANFERAMSWTGERYGDLLDERERAFLDCFNRLPPAARALLVRMVMRKGPLFRESKLAYDEIGDTRAAAAPLLAAGLVDERPALNLDQLFGLLVRSEIAQAFPGVDAALRKAEQLERLRPQWPQARCFDEWLPAARDRVYALRVGEVCDRLRLMFFGNLHQDWTEFVLADLGILRYEQVDISPASRGFGCREDIEVYLRLHACREQIEAGAIPADIPQQPLSNAWLEGRRQKLLFLAGQQQERAAEFAAARRIYAACRHEGARARHIRVLEKCGDHEQAHALAAAAWMQPENEAERQQLARMLPRLRRRVGLPPEAAPPAAAPEEFTLVLPRPVPFPGVELAARDHLWREDAPVHYVENTLINSLFGLLCWDAVFAAVPGAFFHPFHAAPADLHSADFLPRRAAAFDTCLSQLDSGAYRDTIRRRHREKSGLQSPFVYWEAIGDTLLEQALDCLPPEHLKLWFTRLLQDIRANRAGMPDLIRFDLRERRYEMIEVKGPGDRLQDNQLRWIAFCARHGMPVRVCHVRWLEQE